MNTERGGTIVGLDASCDEDRQEKACLFRNFVSPKVQPLADRLQFKGLDVRGATTILLANLQMRNRQAELMDQPDLEADLHAQALQGLARVNWWSRTSHVLWQAIREKLDERTASLRVLDLACGSGDVAVQLAKQAQRDGVRVNVTGTDISPLAIERAQLRAERSDVEACFHVRSALEPTEEKFDVVYCSLFLHHLSNEDAIRLMRNMRKAADRQVLISDLLRSRWGYALSWIGCRILSRSPIVHIDGPRSVEGAFTPLEVRELAHSAGLESVAIKRRWPERFLLEWLRH